MKVALLSYDFGEYCIRLASALAAHAEVLLLLPDGQAAPHRSRINRSVRLLPFEKPRLRQPIRQVLTVRSLVRQIRDFDPDVIHFQRGHLWFNLALPLLKRYPLVMTIHDPRHHLGDRESQKTPQFIMDLGYRLSDHVIVHGQALKRVVVDECRIRAERVHVIPHILLGDDEEQRQIKEEGDLILFFGRIWKYKGLEYLIRAEPLITTQVSRARIVIAGRGESLVRYRRMMAHPQHFIIHNEYVSDEKRAELFRRASVVVLPYVEASQSGVIPLAYTFAKPVVASAVGTLPEMVDHDRTGFLVPPRDHVALADAVVRLLRDEELRRRLGANGKRKLDTECSPEVVAAQTLAVYRQAVEDRHRRGARAPV